MSKERQWLTTEEAAFLAGMTSEWVRQQINARRLPATVWDFGRRRTYRIRVDHWRAFRSHYSRHTDDPEWE